MAHTTRGKTKTLMRNGVTVVLTVLLMMPLWEVSGSGQGPNVQLRLGANYRERFSQTMIWNGCGVQQPEAPSPGPLSEQGTVFQGPDGVVVFEVIVQYQTESFARRAYNSKTNTAAEVIDREPYSLEGVPFERVFVRYASNDAALDLPALGELERPDRRYGVLTVVNSSVHAVYGPSADVLRAFIAPHVDAAPN